MDAICRLPAKKLRRTKSNEGGSALSGCTPLCSWGSRGSAEGQFANPTGVAVISSGMIVVADTANHRIQCFRPDGLFVLKWGRQGTEDDDFDSPVGVAVSVCDGTSACILKAINEIPVVAAFPPGIALICTAYVGEECAYVVDCKNNRVQVFDINGRYQRKWGKHGYGESEFNFPQACCVDRYNQLVYVADTFNHRIQLFQWNGTFIRKWGNRGEFRYPLHVSASRAGLIYVADEGNHRIARYCHDGTLAGEWQTGTDPPSVVVAEDARQVVYVIDRLHNGILLYRMEDGTLLRKIELGGRPYSLASADEHRDMLYVTDNKNNRVMALRVNEL